MNISNLSSRYGSPDGAKLVIRATANLEEKVEIARKLAGITEEVPEP